MSFVELPKTALIVDAPLSAMLLSRGINTFDEAVSFINELPYGRTPNRASWDEVLVYGRGTCSTKHALVAALAIECSCDVSLMLGIFMMSAENTPGLHSVLHRADIQHIPEAHCFLSCEGHHFDITMPGSCSAPPLLVEFMSIEPDQIGAFKVAYHQDYLTRWAMSQGHTFDDVWAIREACILALSA